MSCVIKCESKGRFAKTVFLLLYSCVILALTLSHEYWFDEAQAWNIARDNDIAGIIGMMKYEGHPPLWHLILKLFISMGCSYTALGLISWGVSSITAGVILFVLPAKPYLKAALLLSGNMLYFNSVISRVYCLIGLLLTLIAVVYPKRRRLPVLYGLLVGLLANTHIVMCGLVGALGIFMLVELFAEWKSSSVRENSGKLAGLFTAGFGVLLLVIPLLNSMSANSFAAERKYSIGSVISSFAGALFGIAENACSSNLPMIAGFIMDIAIEAALVSALVLMRKKRKTFVIAIIFTTFFFIVDEVIWYSTPCRGALYFFAAAIIFIMGSEEDCSVPNKKVNDGLTFLKKPLELFGRLDKSTEKSVSILMSIMLALTVPSAAVFAVRDICGEFDPSKAAAEFISKNIPKDAMLISEDDSYAAVLTYLPERMIFSVEYDRYYTYCSHEVRTGGVEFSSFDAELKGHSEVYLITHPGYELSQHEIYSNENYIKYGSFFMRISILKLSPDDIDRLKYRAQEASE